ncbi:hypothetical protein N5J06_07420 [Ralstonia sp. CHL-2022]|uniref:Uncharacterized protein n=1 Tax=Ralstonia mojiangensis TaxID=2953895 RepID=A0ABT2L5U1_9RALS|nr:hypothetical protein [Ralstonia mojiangensis]MCT7310770.1 hypothetical protein [Ralstonia mojiangensis]
MSERVFLLKPCRTNDAQPVLTGDMVVNRLADGGEVCIVLDLNVLNRFKDYMSSSAADRSTDLIGDIAELKRILSMPLLTTTAGFAFGEADESYLDILMESYESFLEAELPGYVDAFNSIPVGRDRVRSRKYRALPAGEQRLFAFTYLSLLKIHDILLSEEKLSPEGKFDLYLEFMDGVADFVPGIETEVAKHCFFKAPADHGDAFFTRSRAIRKNFDKGGRGETRVDRILNGARDIMYLRGAAAKEGKSLDGVIQDTWLLTCDAGVAALNNTIYFYPADGEQSKFTRLTDDSIRQRNSFWRYADRASASLLAERSRTRHGRTEFCNEKHLQVITNLAHSLSTRLALRV